MSILDRYLAYADDFEKTFVDDDWARIGPHFTADAIYEGEPAAKGRAAVVAKLKNSVDSFDRRMDRRIPDFEKPTVQGNQVTMKWRVTYTKTGVPDLVISGKEIATFEGDQIAHLGGEFDPAAQKTMGEWMAKHGKALQG